MSMSYQGVYLPHFLPGCKPAGFSFHQGGNELLLAEEEQATFICCPSAPRNYHLVAQTELEAPINRDATVQRQLETYRSAYRDAPVPHDLLLPLLLDELGPEPATVARTLQGSCLASSEAPRGTVLVLSTSGAIGECLALTVVSPAESLDATSWQSATVAELNLHKAILQIDAKLEVHSCQQLTHWKQQHKEQRQRQQRQQSRAELQMDHAGLGMSFRAPPGASGCCLWVCVRCNTRVHVLRAHQEDENLWDSWCLEWLGIVPAMTTVVHVTWNPTLPEIAFVLEDGSLHTASTSVCTSLRAEDLSSPVPLPTFTIATPAAIHSALCRSLEAGVSAAHPRARKKRRKDSGGGRQAGESGGRESGPRGNGRGADGEEAAGRVQDEQPFDALVLGLRLTCVYGPHPRTLFLSAGRCLWRCNIQAPSRGPSTQLHLLHMLPPGECFTAIARAPPPPRHPFQPAPPEAQAKMPVHKQSLQPWQKNKSSEGGLDQQQEQQQEQQEALQQQLDADALLPLLAAITTKRVLVLDTRRAAHALASWPHGCDADLEPPPYYLSFSQLLRSSSISFYTHYVSMQGDSQGLTHQPGFWGLEEGKSNAGLIGRSTGGKGLSYNSKSGSGEEEGVQMLVVWGNRGAGQVRCAELLLVAPPVQLTLQQEGQDEGGHGVGGLQFHMNAMCRGNGCGEEASYPAVAAAGELVKGHPPGPDVLALQHQTQPHNQQVQQQEWQTQQGWQPACCGRIHIIGSGSPRELCAPKELSRHPMRLSLEVQRAMLHSAGGTALDGFGAGSCAAATAAAEARCWGMQGDLDQRRAALTRAHVHAARQASDLQGLTFVPFMQQTICTGLLLRASHQGDVAVQAITRGRTSNAWMPQHQRRQDSQHSSQQEQQAAAHQEVEGQGMGLESVVPPPEFEDVYYKLLARYPNISAAQRLILGRKSTGASTLNLKAVHSHFASVLAEGTAKTAALSPSAAGTEGHSAAAAAAAAATSATYDGRYRLVHSLQPPHPLPLQPTAHTCAQKQPHDWALPAGFNSSSSKASHCSLDVSGPSVGRIGWQLLPTSMIPPPSLPSPAPVQPSRPQPLPTLSSQASALASQLGHNQAAQSATAKKAVRQLHKALKQLTQGMMAPLTATDASIRIQAAQQPGRSKGDTLLGVYDERIPLKKQAFVSRIEAPLQAMVAPSAMRVQQRQQQVKQQQQQQEGHRQHPGGAAMPEAAAGRVPQQSAAHAEAEHLSILLAELERLASSCEGDGGARVDVAMNRQSMIDARRRSCVNDWAAGTDGMDDMAWATQGNPTMDTQAAPSPTSPFASPPPLLLRSCTIPMRSARPHSGMSPLPSSHATTTAQSKGHHTAGLPAADLWEGGSAAAAASTRGVPVHGGDGSQPLVPGNLSQDTMADVLLPTQQSQGGKAAAVGEAGKAGTDPHTDLTNAGLPAAHPPSHPATAAALLAAGLVVLRPEHVRPITKPPKGASLQTGGNRSEGRAGGMHEEGRPGSGQQRSQGEGGVGGSRSWGLPRASIATVQLPPDALSCYLSLVDDWQDDGPFGTVSDARCLHQVRPQQQPPAAPHHAAPLQQWKALPLQQQQQQPQLQQQQQQQQQGRHGAEVRNPAVPAQAATDITPHAACTHTAARAEGSLTQGGTGIGGAHSGSALGGLSARPSSRTAVRPSSQPRAPKSVTFDLSSQPGAPPPTLTPYLGKGLQTDERSDIGVWDIGAAGLEHPSQTNDFSSQQSVQLPGIRHPLTMNFDHAAEPTASTGAEEAGASQPAPATQEMQQPHLKYFVQQPHQQGQRRAPNGPSKFKLSARSTGHSEGF